MKYSKRYIVILEPGKIDPAHFCYAVRWAGHGWRLPYMTIEFRLFRGTLKLNTLYATLQFVNRIVDTALTLSESEITDQSWSDFVAGITEPELIQYLKERRIYINEEVKVEEEV